MKKKITAIILMVVLVLALAMPMAAVGADPGPGLVGLWHFDGNADDSSGNGNDGTVYGVETYVASPMGQALSFDGINDYVEIADDDDLDITGDLTIEAWVKLDTNSDLMYVVAKDLSGQRSYGLFVDGRAGHNGEAVLIVFNDSGVNSSVRGDTTLNTGQWYHLAGTYDYVGAGTSVMKLYVDGSLDSTAVTNAVGPIKSGSANLQIGAREYVGQRQFFDGLIDEVRIWDEALTVDEIGLDLFDVTVNAEGSALAVDIDWSYGSPYVADVDGVTSDTDTTTEFTLESIIEGTPVTLTAPAIHDEGWTFYVFDHWSWSVDGTTFDTAKEDFTITEDTTITAHYTMVMSVDKTLEEYYLVPFDTVTVPADSASGAASSTALENGKSYLLEASGTFSAAAGITADAEYSSGPDSYVWQEPVEKYGGYGVDLLDLKVDGGFVDWGAFNQSHVYTLAYTGTGSTVSFLIYDLEPYSNNSGSLTVQIYEVYDSGAVPLGEEWYFGMTITVHAYAEVSDVYVEDGIGADLVVAEVGGFPVTPPDGQGWEQDRNWRKNEVSEDLNLVKKGKVDKMGATKVEWTIGEIGELDVGEDFTLDIVVYTGENPKGKQEYTSTGSHELNSGPEVWFTYDGELYMLQGPSVSVTVGDDEG